MRVLDKMKYKMYNKEKRNGNIRNDMKTETHAKRK